MRPRLLRFVLTSLCVLSVGRGLFSQAPHAEHIRYDGADWHLKGDGIVCCPCAVPCPCRTNAPPTYGHCEATLYLHVMSGHYGAVDMSGMQLAHTSGSCSMSYQNLSSLYFDQSVNPEQQTAFMKLVTSFFPGGAAAFPYVRTVPMQVHVEGGHLYTILIPHILQMVVDRNWGQPSTPFPFFAADDHFSNTLQYVENIRYQMHDEDAKLNFDYSHRQANYRTVDLDVQQYRSKSMLIQYQNGIGHFNDDQLRLIKEQNLQVPDLKTVSVQVTRFKQAARSRAQ